MGDHCALERGRDMGRDRHGCRTWCRTWIGPRTLYPGYSPSYPLSPYHNYPRYAYLDYSLTSWTDRHRMQWKAHPPSEPHAQWCGLESFITSRTYWPATLDFSWTWVLPSNSDKRSFAKSMLAPSLFRAGLDSSRGRQSPATMAAWTVPNFPSRAYGHGQQTWVEVLTFRRFQTWTRSPHPWT